MGKLVLVTLEFYVQLDVCPEELTEVYSEIKGQKHDFVHGGNIHYCIAAEGRGYVHTRPLTETSLSHTSNMVRSDWPSGSGSLRALSI